MSTRRCLGAAVLVAAAILAGCGSDKTDGKGVFADAPKSQPSSSEPSKTPSSAGPANSLIDLTQWSRHNACDILQMSTSATVGIKIATPVAQNKGGGCIYGAKKSTYGIQFMRGDLSEMSPTHLTAGPVHYRQNGLAALKYCTTERDRLGCYVVVQAAPKRLYMMADFKPEGTGQAGQVQHEMGAFCDAIYSSLKARTILHPNVRERYPTQQEYDGKRKAGLHPDIDVCDGRLLRFTDFPYDGMKNSSQPGPTRFRNGPESVDYDILCSWDVHDFVKGYTPPPASEPEQRDPSIDLSDSLGKVSEDLKNIADIYSHSRAIIVNVGFSNDGEMWKRTPQETTYQEAGRSVIIDKQADSESNCGSRFRYAKGSVVLVVGDSTGGRYGSPCDATRALTSTLLDREPH